MLATCPNCSHPLRTGAKFCGFCGTDLNALVNVEPLAAVQLQEKGASNADSNSKKGVKTRQRDPVRIMSIIAIIILFLIIFLSLIVQYWANIFPLFDQFLRTIISQ